MAIVNRNRKNGSPGYQVRVKDRYGKWFAAKTFIRKVDAERHERTLLGQRDIGKSAPNQSQKSMTMKEYWDLWSVQCRTEITEGWKLSQNQMARDYILSSMGYMKLTDIRSQDIGRAISSLESIGRSSQTRLHVYNLLNKMFGDAIHYFELLDRNPVIKRLRPSVNRKERNFLRSAESWRLLEATRNHFLGPAIWLGLLTGLRPCEIQALEWSAVDFERKRIIIKSAFKRKVGKLEDTPKQGDWGSAPIPEILLEYFRTIRATSNSNWVAPGERGNMLSYEVFNRCLKKLCIDLDLIAITPHELRHSCSELWVQCGANELDVSRLLNHSSTAVTQTYMHRTDDRLNTRFRK